MHVLFLCPHGAAKSVLATALLRDLARRDGIDLTVSNAGTEPDPAINPVALAALARRTLEFSDVPRRVDRGQIAAADIVVSLGCRLEELPATPKRFVDWSDVPDASEDVDGLCEVLSSRLGSLLS
ncbi:MAG: hypothetical protein HKN74_14340 [Acidimicrobiia bacterium]|nr:hypothetical protein [Acidimicrobiia bacterium]MBT8216544.1 hypothetical protein [Acidimicrobiia bacterium]NNF11453.1 hypothetical protein [Acidimicrobiia bacterium]NNL69623.1 hypothetical protein [Acidimicrobiia bacterium]